MIFRCGSGVRGGEYTGWEENKVGVNFLKEFLHAVCFLPPSPIPQEIFKQESTPWERLYLPAANIL